MNAMRLLKSRFQAIAGRNRLYRGQVLATAALMMPVLCGMMGLAIDAGYLYHLKRRMQTAADAGAIAAAHELKRGSLESMMVYATRVDVGLNGFDGSHGETIAVNRPPTAGSRAGDLDFVEVIITQNQPTFFMRVLGFNSTTVQVRAVGGLVPAATACVYVLDPSAEKAFEVSSNSTLNATCGCIVNSSHRYGLSVQSGSHLMADSIDVHGNYEATSGSTITPEPSTGAAREDDPLADLQPPTVGGCNYNSPGNFPQKVDGSMGQRTLNPGVYCGGISIESGRVTFNPGTYILRGGGLRITSGSTVTGNGVAFYNTTHSSHAYKPVDIDSNSTVTLTAPTTGTMAGILFFGDRNHNGPSDITNYIRSGSGSQLEGTLYFPTQRLEISSNSTTNSGANWTMIIAQRLRVHSNSYFHVKDNYEASAARPPIKKPALVE